jgi:uncharacterized protein
MDYRPPLDLLESTHEFPGVYQIKAIGDVDEDFESRVLASVRAEVESPAKVDYSVRSTPDGRHVALTLHVTVRNAEQVREIYGRIQELKGLKMLF